MARTLFRHLHGTEQHWGLEPWLVGSLERVWQAGDTRWGGLGEAGHEIGRCVEYVGLGV